MFPMSEEPEIPLHEYQDLVRGYDHLEPDEELGDTIGEYIDNKVEQLYQENHRYAAANEKVGRGRQGTKWRVKWKRNLGKIDQLEQVREELRRLEKLDQPIQ